MALKSFVKIQLKDEATNRFQDNVASSFNEINQTKILGGNLLQIDDRRKNTDQLYKGIKIVTGNNYINHKLGRALVGWVITRQRSAASIYDNQDSMTAPGYSGPYNPATTLILFSDANTYIDLWVF